MSLDFRTKMNSNCERGGRELLRQAKELNKARRNESAKVADAAAKDMATYFHNKAVGRIHTSLGHVRYNPNKRIEAGRWEYQDGKLVKVA